MPIKKTFFLSFGVEWSGFCGSNGSNFPFNFIPIKSAGIKKQTNDGIIVLIIILAVVTWLPIQSIVVVTSPIGLHAPPAFAEITIKPANISRSLWEGINLRSRDTITMVVVRLSSTAERKNVRRPTIQTSLRLLVVVIRWVITSKPSCASINSTITMAPSKKKSIPAISERWCPSSSDTNSLSFPNNAKIDQQITPVSNADAALLILIGCSKAIAR